MNLQPVIESLTALPQLQQVQFGAQIGREDVVGGLPAVYVAPFKEVAGETVNSTVVLQTVEQTFLVSLVCAYAQLDEAREAILSALVGKALYPSGNVALIEFVEGEQVEATGSLVHWRDVFSARKERRFT